MRGSNAQLTVEWDKMKGRRVHSQSHIHKGEYVCEYEVYKCIILDTTLKDPRLHALVTSIRGALRRGFTNGQMKTVTYDIVDVVQTTGLCPKQSQSLNVLAAYLFFCFQIMHVLLIL